MTKKGAGKTLAAPVCGANTLSCGIVKRSGMAASIMTFQTRLFRLEKRGSSILHLSLPHFQLSAASPVLTAFICPSCGDTISRHVGGSCCQKLGCWACGKPVAARLVLNLHHTLVRKPELPLLPVLVASLDVPFGLSDDKAASLFLWPSILPA